MSDNELCPCNSGGLYSNCCGPLLVGDKKAITAEALMRSRYTAYVERKISYLLDTWHPSTRPANVDPATIPEWYGLHIIKSEAGDATSNRGIVEFKATSLLQNRVWTLHEISRFLKENGQWFYVDGDIVEDLSPETRTKKVGRNEPCSCGSGKKFKKCCENICSHSGKNVIL